MSSDPTPPASAAQPTCLNPFGNDVHDFIPVAQCRSTEPHSQHSWGDVYVGGGHCCGYPKPEAQRV